MKRKLLITVVCLAVLGGGIGAKTAHAVQVNPIGKPVAKMTLKEQVIFYKANIWKAQSVLHWYHQGKGKWALNNNRFPAAYSSAIRVVRYHERLLRNATRNLAAVVRKLIPPRPAHYYGWLCIHSNEGAWDANTGNGYYGGLQAHENWYGVARMDFLSPMAQMWHAEAVAAQNNFSYSFMHGQWPNTYPPCAKYF